MHGHHTDLLQRHADHSHDPKRHQQLSGLCTTKSDARKCKVLKGTTCSMILLVGKSETATQSDWICRVFGPWSLEEWLARQKNEKEYKRLICAAWRITLKAFFSILLPADYLNQVLPLAKLQQTTQQVHVTWNCMWELFHITRRKPISLCWIK